jgi:hypothetical protein
VDKLLTHDGYKSFHWFTLYPIWTKEPEFAPQRRKERKERQKQEKEYFFCNKIGFFLSFPLLCVLRVFAVQILGAHSEFRGITYRLCV